MLENKKRAKWLAFFVSAYRSILTLLRLPLTTRLVPTLRVVMHTGLQDNTQSVGASGLVLWLWNEGIPLQEFQILWSPYVYRNS